MDAAAGKRIRADGKDLGQVNRFMIHNSTGKHGHYYGVVPETAAARNGSTPLTFDHDLDALPEAGRRMTVAALADHVDDLAARLWAAGVRPGEQIAIYKGANFDVWMLATAAARIAAVPVLLSHHLDGATAAALLGRLDRPYLLTDAAKLDVLADVPVTDFTRTVISATDSRPGVASLAEFAGAPRVEPVFQPPDEPEVITHTSGTTGVPKLVVHTPRRIRARLRPQALMLGLIRKRETVAVHVPFLHSRMFAAMSLALHKEMPVVLVKDPHPDNVARLFAEHRPGLIEALPNAFLDWEGLADDPRKPFASVRYFSSTFDAMHPRTISRLLGSSERRAPLFFQMYGQTEVGPAIGRPYFRRSAHRVDGRCVGYPVPGGPRIRVVSRDGKRPSKRNPGFIEARWSGLAKTYYGEQERYDANMHDGWWRTGDVGFRGRYGCWHMLDREIDMIAGVESILEIEDVVLSKLDEISELVVVPGAKSEPVPVICTNGDQPLDLDRWRAVAAEFPQLGEPIQIPLARLPRTGTLKVRRVELSRLLHDQLAQTGNPERLVP